MNKQDEQCQTYINDAMDEEDLFGPEDDDVTMTEILSIGFVGVIIVVCLWWFLG